MDMIKKRAVSDNLIKGNTIDLREKRYGKG